MAKFMNMVGGPFWWEALGPGPLGTPKSGASCHTCIPLGAFHASQFKNPRPELNSAVNIIELQDLD